MPRLSVILPVYNGEAFVSKSIASVLAQSFGDFELITINDGSTDATAEIVDSFQDGRIVRIEQGNLGLQKTLNRALQMAKGQYIARIDADDQWTDPSKLEKQIKFLDENPEYVLLGTSALVVDGSGKEFVIVPPLSDGEIRSKMLSANNFFHSSVVFRKSAAAGIGGYSEAEECSHVEDYDLWMRLGKVGKVANLPIVSLRYESSNREAISEKNRKDQLKKNIALIERYKIDYPGYAKFLVRNYLKLFVYGYLNLFSLRKLSPKFQKNNGGRPALFVWESLSTISGGQKVLLNLLPELNKEFNVTVLLPGAGEFSDAIKKTDAKVKHFHFGLFSLGKKSLWDVLRYICIFPFGLVQCLVQTSSADLFYVNSARVLPLAWVVAKIRNVPLVLHNHSNISDGKSRTILLKIGKSRTVKKIIAVTEAVKQNLPELSSKTAVVHNGVDLSLFGFKPKEKAKHVKIGVVADLVPSKGQDLAIQALAKSGLDYHLYLAGSARKGYEDYRRLLENLVEKEKQKEKISFLGKISDVQNFISEMDLILLPSRVQEACPLSVLEALACGRPVISSDYPGAGEIIKEGYNGYTFRSGNPSDLKNKIVQFCNLDESAISFMQKNCRKSAEKKFDLADANLKICGILKNASRDQSADPTIKFLNSGAPIARLSKNHSPLGLRLLYLKWLFSGKLSIREFMVLGIPSGLSEAKAKLQSKMWGFLDQEAKQEMKGCLLADGRMQLFGKPFDGPNYADNLFFIEEVVHADSYQAKELIIKPDFVIIDAGAHIGTFTVMAANLAPQGKIYSFEPSKKTFGYLLRNSSGYPSVRCFNLGLGDSASEKNIFTVDIGNNGSENAMEDSPLLAEMVKEHGEFEKVRVTTIDEVVKEQGIPKVDMVKIDTEGYEEKILIGAAETIKRDKPVIVMSAYHKPNDRIGLPELLKSISPDYSCRLHQEKTFNLVCIPIK